MFFRMGNADPNWWSWREAIRLGYRWLREGKVARVNGRPAEMRISAVRKLQFNPADLIQIAGWMIARGSRARANAGNKDKRYDP